MNHQDPIKIQPHLQSHPTNVLGVWALKNPWNRKNPPFEFFLSRLSKEKTLQWKKGRGTVPDMGVLSKAIPQGSPLSISQSNLFHLPRKRKRETEEGGKNNYTMHSECCISMRSGFTCSLIANCFGTDWPNGLHSLIKLKYYPR